LHHVTVEKDNKLADTNDDDEEEDELNEKTVVTECQKKTC